MTVCAPIAGTASRFLGLVAAIAAHASVAAVAITLSAAFASVTSLLAVLRMLLCLLLGFLTLLLPLALAPLAITCCVGLVLRVGASFGTAFIVRVLVIVAMASLLTFLGAFLLRLPQLLTLPLALLAFLLRRAVLLFLATDAVRFFRFALEIARADAAAAMAVVLGRPRRD